MYPQGPGVAVPPEDSANRPIRRFNRSLAERLTAATMLCDAALAVYLLLFSYWVRFHTSLRLIGPEADLTLASYASYIGVGAITLVFAFAYAGVYDPRALLRIRQIGGRILKGGLIWFVSSLALTLVFRFDPPISRIYAVVAASFTIGGVLIWRGLFHRWLRRSRMLTELRQRVLFVGWNSDSRRLTRDFNGDPASAYDVAGCVLSPRTRYQQTHNPPVRVIGSLKEIPSILRDENVDIVMLADCNFSRRDVISLSNLCEQELVSFKIVPSYFQILVSGLQIETVSGLPVLGVSQLPLDRFFNAYFKRLIDLIGATFGLVFFAPIMAIFGALVYFESPGPVIYRQTRLGRHGERFEILKIRSMRLDAERDQRPGWTTKNDPRRLRVGAFMRKWNIDELPQFWNVLKGEMSLVGPRPERPELILNFKYIIPHYQARHNVKPGITGWAQVKGLRGDTDLVERINCDLFYLENWSLLLDFQIMGMTFFKTENAC